MEPYDFESSDRLPKSDLVLLPVVGLACALWLSLTPLLAPIMALAALARRRT
jgi:hypothetical protein